jgi:hypothetical protein
MPIFLATLGVGLGGLLLMALPGMRHHGRAGHAHARGHTTHGHVRAHAQARAALKGQTGAKAGAHAAHPHAPPKVQQDAAHGVADGVLRWVPEPRLIFSLLALFGASGNVLQHALHQPVWIAALGGAGIAGVLEGLVVGPLWRFALKFTGEPTSPLDSLVMDHAEAVTPFRNGKGIVRAVLDGRAVQLSAELVAEERGLPVRVGDQVTVQEVDPDHEHVRVSVG